MKESFEYSFFWMCWYNGYEDYLLEIAYRLDHFEKQDDYDHFSLFRDVPETWREEIPQEFFDWIWGLLVLQFGNYGTSPRGGWIEKPEKAARFLISGMFQTFYENDAEELKYLMTREDSWLAKQVFQHDLADEMVKVNSAVKEAHKED